MPIKAKYTVKHETLLRDTRPLGKRLAEVMSDSAISFIVFFGATFIMLTAGLVPGFQDEGIASIPGKFDFALILGLLYFWWLWRRKVELPLKMPLYAGDKMRDPHNIPPGGGGPGKCEGILYLGNDKDFGYELWLTNSDARTHILFLGTTGSGKTEGLKALAVNALCWGSGFVYVDGKADTNLWADTYSLVRRFGRDDDLLVLNYMTGNSDTANLSNSMNPFSSGSASYLTQMLVSLMPEAGGDNAMWKERAVALIGSLMPALTYKRDHQMLLMDIGVVRDHLELPAIIRLSRDPSLPERIIRGLQSYLSTLPGYIDDAFDDDGNERPPSPDSPPYDMTVARQQHGYLSMQFTRMLQSLSDEYGFIFKAQLADVDVVDVVLQRRMLVVLIPALEKSGDEAANLGKIVAAALKGMMGSTLGAQIEGSWETAIENKPTAAPSPYITIFDEVGYYTSQGMAVMAAQARSLGFSLVFAAQDLPAMEKRVREEARSITGNCNLKIFGKLEDPTGTKEFFDKTVGSDLVMETTGFSLAADSTTNTYMDRRDAGLQLRNRASYDALKGQREGQVHMLFAQYITAANFFHARAEKVRALRVQRMLPVPPTTNTTAARDRAVADIGTKLRDPEWLAINAGTTQPLPEITALAEGYNKGLELHKNDVAAGISAIVQLSQGVKLKAGKGTTDKFNPNNLSPEQRAENAKNAPRIGDLVDKKAPAATTSTPSAAQSMAQNLAVAAPIINPTIMDTDWQPEPGKNAAVASAQKNMSATTAPNTPPATNTASSNEAVQKRASRIDTELLPPQKQQGEFSRAGDGMFETTPDATAQLQRTASAISRRLFGGNKGDDERR